MKLDVKKISRLFIILLALAVVLQLGSVLAETAFHGGSSSAATDDAVNTELSDATLGALKKADPARYDRNVALFKNTLIRLNVHETFKNEIERLVQEGKSLHDLLVAFEFLYQQYGKIGELEPMVEQKEGGKSWAAIFTDYNRSHKPFEPRNFDSQHLERLSSMPGVTPDDIMLADRLSFVSGKKVDEIIAEKTTEKRSWKWISTSLGVVNSASAFPIVQITENQMAKFATGSFKQEKVAEAFVLAQKLGRTPDNVVSQMKAGKSEEAIMAEAYEEKYN